MATFDLQNINPNADPAMLAWLRTITANEATAQLAAQSQKANIARNIQMSTPTYQDNLNQGLSNISKNAVGTGLWSSGKRLKDQAQFQTDQQRTRNAQLQDATDQSNSIDLQLAQQIAENRRNQQEQELASRQTIGLQQANAGLYG
jgi:hypothetical protein